MRKPVSTSRGISFSTTTDFLLVHERLSALRNGANVLSGLVSCEDI